MNKKIAQKQTNKKEMKKKNTTQKSNSQDILMCVM